MTVTYTYTVNSASLIIFVFSFVGSLFALLISMIAETDPRRILHYISFSLLSISLLSLPFILHKFVNGSWRRMISISRTEE